MILNQVNLQLNVLHVTSWQNAGLAHCYKMDRQMNE